MRKVCKWIGITLAVPVTLLFVIGTLLYIPMIQNFLVNKATQYATQSTGMEVEIGRLRLGFPLDLVVQEVTVVSNTDTLLAVYELRASVQLLPLLRGNAQIDELSLTQAAINTLELIEGTHIKGNIGYCRLVAHGVDLADEIVTVNNLELGDANVWIALKDSVQADTATSSPVNWKIILERIQLQQTALTLSMPGDTMHIGTRIAGALLTHGVIDLQAGRYDVEHFALQADTLTYNLTNQPQINGLDYNHILLTQVKLATDSLSYGPVGLKLFLQECAMREKSGIHLTSLTTQIEMTQEKVNIPNLSLRTLDSSIDAAVDMDFRALDSTNTDGRLYLRLLAELGKQDILTVLGDMPDTFAHLYPNHPLVVKALLDGNMRSLRFSGVEVHLKEAFELSARGKSQHLLSGERLAGEATLTATTHDLRFILALADSTLLNTFAIPSLQLNGDCSMNGHKYKADMSILAPRGRVNLDARFDAQNFAYIAHLDIDSLQLHDFMPKDSLFFLTAHVDANGVGDDLLASKTWSNLSAKIDRFEYGKDNFGGITADVKLKQGIANATLTAQNQLIAATLNTTANLNAKRSDARFDLKLDHIDLYKLGVVENPIDINMNLNFQGASNFKDHYELLGDITNIQIKTTKEEYKMKDIGINLYTQRDSTYAYLNAATLNFRLNATGGYERLIKETTAFTDELLKQLEINKLDEETLKGLLPNMQFRVDAEKDNPLYNTLAMNGYTFEKFSINLATSPWQGINGTSLIRSLNTGTALLDTIRFDIKQDSTGMVLQGGVCNNKKNPQFIFNLLVDGYLRNTSAGIHFLYLDDKGEEGLKLGANALLEQDGFRVHLTPEKPIIAYRHFTLNDSNFVYVGDDQRIQADIDLLADDQTHLKIFSIDDEDALQDITLSISKLNLDELTSVIPYAPRVLGFLHADLHLIQTQKSLSVSADLEVKDMVLEGNALGDIEVQTVYLPNASKSHYVDTQVMRNHQEVMSLSGTYFESGQIEVDASLERFPLDILNGFIPDQMVAFEGYINGDMQIEGPLEKTIVNGQVVLDSVYLQSLPYGFNLRFTNTPIPVIDSKLVMDRINIYSKGKNPLFIDGNIDFTDFANVKLDIGAGARNFELINAEYTPKSLVYGKVNVDFGTKITGPLDHLSIRGGMSVLGTTNVTYVLKDSPLTVEDRLSDLVTFVDFADTTKVQENENYEVSAIDMQLSVKVEETARLNCDLSPDRQSYVNLEGGGTLSMRYSPQGDIILSGRYTINQGNMKYALPIIPLKDFTVKSGSYIEFAGNPENPILNIAATERVRASVTENSVSRTVAFDVGVAITRPLNDMGLEFTLQAPEDMSVQNQLAAMSVEERGKMAVTMLATGMYLGSSESGSGGSKLDVNSALNSFLQSEITNIAGNALKTIDVSLGMESGTAADGTSQTDYSFKFAKRFWGNRVSVIIGGKVSTGESVDVEGQTFIDNVSLEYRLDKGASRYVRLFYDNNKYDVLEGRIMETGGGLVLRKKVDRLSELFIFRENKQNSTTENKPRQQR